MRQNGTAWLVLLLVFVLLCPLLSSCRTDPPAVPAAPGPESTSASAAPETEPTAPTSAPEAGPTAEHVDLPAAMFVLDESSIGKSKVFRRDGFTITLTDLFREQKSEMGFYVYYNSPFCGVMILKEPFSMQEGLEDESLVEYVEHVIRNNGHDTHPIETDGLIYYRFSNPYPDFSTSGTSYCFKGSDAFYIFQFICLETDAERLADTIFFFAKSVTVE